MDFMKLLKSLEELLYELVSWLVFYPVTMWRSIVRPLEMMRYADTELADKPEDQYEDTLSPPLFLLITLLLSQGLSSALPSIYDSTAAARELGSASNLLIARGVIFGIYPLCMAVTLLRSKNIRITRNSLRPPFFSQCYIAAPFAFVLVLGFDFFSMPREEGALAGLITIAVTSVWYAQAQIRWFIQDLGMGGARAIFVFFVAFLFATVAASVVALLITLDAKSIAPVSG
ncbi:permease [Agrobacterium rosae]|uniref:Permease n=1 Tax=Agrobacterium rosae TaxID=1972867 RepID=A0AAE5RUF4_9HYPH|nr:permease [Agrobacterium rosae]KAA3513449.1 permease [Agrobacterium rosae]MQB51003.1 permease [Agrobacterium rosae]POO49405.1 permease [Agrobacterium rosae]